MKKNYKQRFKGQPYRWRDGTTTVCLQYLPVMPPWVKNIFSHDMVQTEDNKIEFVAPRRRKQTTKNKQPSSHNVSNSLTDGGDSTYSTDSTNTTDDITQPPDSNIEQTVRTILKHLDPARADAYDGWIRVLFALSTVASQYGANLLPLGDEWSRQSHKYKGIDDVRSGL